MGSIVDTLAAHASQQIEAASSGRPLAYRDAESHPSVMVEAPANNLGALYRAAYWSAVASRIALSQGSSPGALLSLANARYRSATMSMAGGAGPLAVLGFVYSPSATGDIDGILREVEQLSARFGVEEVASTMWLQRQQGAQQHRRDTVKPEYQLSIPFLGTGLDQINKRVVTIVTVVAVGSAVLLVLGVGLWLAKPILAPAARVAGDIAGQAARDAYESRRARRRARRSA